MSQYHFKYDEDYVLSFAWQYRKQLKVRHWITAVRVLCFAGLVTLAALIVFLAIRQPSGSRAGPLSLSILPLFFMVLLGLGPRIDHFFAIRRFRKSPFYGCSVRVDIKDDGIGAATDATRGFWNWKAYTAAKRLPEGFLLFSGRDVTGWLPHGALVAGTMAEVEAKLRSSIKTFESHAT